MRQILLSLFSLFLASGVEAASTVVTERARSTLASETSGVAAGQDVTLVFSQSLKPGWHVYWKNPGDSGLPLTFKWSLPSGATAGDIDYPPPHRIPVGPLVNFGHEGEPVFLTSVSVPENAQIGSVFDIGLEATWLICAEICVPETGVFALSLPVVAQPDIDPAVQQAASAARAAAPKPLAGAARFDVSANALVLEVDAPADIGGEAFFFPSMEGLIEPAAKQVQKLSDGVLKLSMKAGYAAGDAADFERLEGVLIFQSRGETTAFEVSAEKADLPMTGSFDSEDAGPIFGLLVAAFVGGALLNLMPCVFPILFVKAASLAEAASSHPGMLKRHGLLYGAGVVATFLILGGLLLFLRAAGEGVGWGFHLQSPVVVAISAYVLFLVGLNFVGVFNIAESLQGVGSELSPSQGGWGAFMTGVLAVFVAAPCIGPFLTAPIGAAAILPAWAGLAIFLFMALGLAAPYMALSFSPALARLLPRPGGWMEVFRKALSFPVFAAACYFIWVLAQQAGPAGLAMAFVGLLLLGLAAWLWGMSQTGGMNRVRFGAVLAIILALATLGFLKTAPATAAASSYGEVQAVAFDPDDIDGRRAAGETIFIDFTAAWCVTCQVNKLTVLSSGRVIDAFLDQGVTLVVADWTRRDDEIAGALAGFGANGVPLYVVYPKGGEAVVLGLPLTENAIISALDG